MDEDTLINTIIISLFMFLVLAIGITINSEYDQSISEKEFCEKHNGTYEIQTRLGYGGTFKYCLIDTDSDGVLEKFEIINGRLVK